MFNKARSKSFIVLHLLLLVYSLTGVFSKLASGQPFLSLWFCVYYGMVIVLLGIYAIGWQQVIKQMPLTTAFANKAVTVVWGIVWGMMFFSEQLTVGKLVGALLVVLGVVLFATADREGQK